jgi:uncharacterized membrane protein YbaN (DUF454 family)
MPPHRRSLLPKARGHTRSSVISGTGVVAGGTQIEIDARAQSILLRDDRVFQPGQRAFCLRMMEAIAEQLDISKAQIDFSSATCRIDFSESPRTPLDLANAFAQVVRNVIASPAAADPPRWLGPPEDLGVLTAYRFEQHASVWHVTARKPGEVRMGHQWMAQGYEQRSLLAAALSCLDGLAQCRASRWSPALTIRCRPESPLANSLVDEAERTWEALFAVKSTSSDALVPLGSPGGIAPVVATGPRRALNLMLAGGCLALTVVALLVPGLPTVPFLLATSYYLARSSPRLDAILRRTRFIGPIISEWDRYHGLSWSSKRNLIGLTVVIVLVTLALMPYSPWALVAMLIVSALCVRSVTRLPGLPAASNTEALLSGPSRPLLALTGPSIDGQ